MKNVHFNQYVEDALSNKEGKLHILRSRQKQEQKIGDYDALFDILL